MIKVLELFGGIGACTKALKRCGIDFEVVDYVEIDKYAVKSYNAINGTNFEPQDITKWDKDIEVDLIMHGSPCQDFSIVGKGFGGDENSGTRSSLMYETIRIVKKLKPKYIIWENVKNLLSKTHIHNFNSYLKTMDSLGYSNYYQVLNAKDYGIPQNRERVFTISILGLKSFVFPPKLKLNLKLKDMLENEVDEKYYLSEKMVQYIMADNEKWVGSNNKSLINKTIASTINTAEGSKRCDASNYIANDLPENTNLKEYGFGNKRLNKTLETNSIEDGDFIDAYNKSVKKDVAGTITTRVSESNCTFVVVDKIPIKNNTKQGYLLAYPGDGIYINPSNKRETAQKESIPTLTTCQDKGVVENDLRIRKLTPKECWRLMGFDDADFEKAEKVNSNTQLYKQAGNSIVVDVLQAILKNLLQEKHMATLFDFMEVE